MNLQEEADKLRQEAKGLLQAQFKNFPPFRSEGLDRIVDCIVSAALLEITVLHQRHGF